METIKINNKILTFEKVLYVDVNGNNETGDGSYNNPYQSLDKALLEAQDNYCIFIRRGTYRLKPIIATSLQDSGIYDYGRALTIIGENEKTVLEFYGSDGKARDNCLVRLPNPNSLLAKLKINYYPPNKSANYSKAIAIACRGTIKNVIFENISKISWSYSYYNDAPANSPKFENCIFISHGYSTSDYSGNPLYTNCLFDATPSRGTRQYCITRTITEEDLQEPTKDSDLYCSGNPNTFNPDGTQAHIGVYGGEFAWGNWTKSLLKSNNKYYTYRNNEFIEVEPTVENFKEKSIYLPDLITPTDKVVLTMEGGEELEDGRLYRKTIDISKYKDIERIEVNKGE